MKNTRKRKHRASAQEKTECAAGRPKAAQHGTPKVWPAGGAARCWKINLPGDEGCDKIDATPSRTISSNIVQFFCLSLSLSTCIFQAFSTYMHGQSFNSHQSIHWRRLRRRQNTEGGRTRRHERSRWLPAGASDARRGYRRSPKRRRQAIDIRPAIPLPDEKIRSAIGGLMYTHRMAATQAEAKQQHAESTPFSKYMVWQRGRPTGG
uniref:Uncharacterized protein n=1 Tax=Oryza rufipogon TaxID=4529 RepID=A0A0E0RII7_ORYRU